MSPRLAGPGRRIEEPAEQRSRCDRLPHGQRPGRTLYRTSTATAPWVVRYPGDRLIVRHLRADSRCAFEIATNAAPYRGVRGQARACHPRWTPTARPG
ncbi:MAG: hypothetical protein U0802_12345 [Candidatus Binatia bacterium]